MTPTADYFRFACRRAYWRGVVAGALAASVFGFVWTLIVTAAGWR